MNRREFLTLGAVAAASIFLPAARLAGLMPAISEVQVDGRLYRGGAGGKIYTSSDQGKTWPVHTFLGPEYSILDLFVDRRDRVYVKVGYRGHSFFLALSADRKRWKTVA